MVITKFTLRELRSPICELYVTDNGAIQPPATSALSPARIGIEDLPHMPFLSILGTRVLPSTRSDMHIHNGVEKTPVLFLLRQCATYLPLFSTLPKYLTTPNGFL